MSIKVKSIEFNTNEDLVSLLNDFSTSGFATLESTTIPKTTVKSRIDKIPYQEKFDGKVLRTKKEYVTLGLDYSSCVNKQREKEGNKEEFKAEQKDYLQDVNKYIVQHKTTGQYYLRYFLDMNANYQHSQYIWHDEKGEELNDNQVKILTEEFLPKKSGSKKQETEKEILIRNVKIDGINKLVFGGVEFIRS